MIYSRSCNRNIDEYRLINCSISTSSQGIGLVCELIDYYGLDVVQSYMSYVRHNAEVAVRSLLKDVAAKTSLHGDQCVLEAEDFMDDGTCIRLKVSIDAKEGSAIFDFT